MAATNCTEPQLYLTTTFAAAGLLALKGVLQRGAGAQAPDLEGGDFEEEDALMMEGTIGACKPGQDYGVCRGLPSWRWGADPCGYPAWQGVTCNEVRPWQPQVRLRCLCRSSDGGSSEPAQQTAVKCSAVLVFDQAAAEAQLPSSVCHPMQQGLEMELLSSCCRHSGAKSGIGCGEAAEE